MGMQPAASVPVITGRQLLPHLGRIQKDAIGYLYQLAAEKGDAVHFKLGRINAFFLNHPDLIKHVLQDNNKNFSKDTIQYNALSTVTGKGLLTSDGALWLRQRRLEQAAFSRARLRALDGVIIPAAQRMLRTWETIAAPEGVIDVDDEMMRLTLEVVGRALFGIDLSSEARQLTQATLTALDHIIHRARNPLSLPDAIPTPENIRFRRAIKTLEATIARMISGRRNLGDAGEDMLGMLLKARDDDGSPMTDGQIRDEVITLLIAGHETVASALTWSWYLLAQAPHIRAQLRQEAVAVLGDRMPTTDDLERMPLGGQVFDEALRLYPPAWLITRKAIAA
ncbi:MAG: cytochrome P450, partial [Anaerolineae bacterium]|nr:cytochrome P450 [Anaerolineae bacterium]